MINVEIKAKATVDQQTFIRNTLHFQGAVFKGTDNQIDTYFKVSNGRLKLRQGNIENCLIQYERQDQTGPKVSKYTLAHLPVVTTANVKEALQESLGILIVVDKVREIYYLDNIKIHLDVVRDFGTFVEIEARDEKEVIGKTKLEEQTNRLMLDFKIRTEDLISDSYSDMLLKGQ